jgi:ELWxxDGT repeat protein
LGNTLIFWANDGVHGAELWVSDGTGGGTQMVRDIWPGSSSSNPYGFTVSGNRVFFFAATQLEGQELWVSDGAAAGTGLVSDVWPGVNSGSGLVAGGTYGQGAIQMVPFGNGVLFNGYTGGSPFLPALYRSDGTALGTGIVVASALDPRWFTPLGAGYTFTAYSPGIGTEPWFTDGTTAGTVLLADTVPGTADGAYAQGLGTKRRPELAGRHWFVSGSLATPYMLWSTDGTPAGTSPFFDPTIATPGAQVRNVRGAGDRLYVEITNATQGSEMYVTDGVSPPTLVVDFNPGTSPGWNSFTDWLALGEGRLAITVMRQSNDISDEPAITNGTAAGTYMLANLFPGNLNTSIPRGFTRIGDRVFFAATNLTNGRELWSLDVATLPVAEATQFGAGCAGTGGLVPKLQALGTPAFGNAAFALRLFDGAANAPAVVFVDFASAAIPLGSCTVWLQALTLSGAGLTDAGGAFQLPVSLAGSTALVGLDFFGQGFVLDAGGALLGGLGSLSNALAVRVGY